MDTIKLGNKMITIDIDTDTVIDDAVNHSVVIGDIVIFYNGNIVDVAKFSDCTVNEDGISLNSGCSFIDSLQVK